MTIDLYCRENIAEVVIPKGKILTSGMVGLKCRVHLDDAWEGMTVRFIARSGETKIPQTILDGVASIPPECLVGGEITLIGVDGWSADGHTKRIPTMWASCGVIRASVADGDESEPSQPTEKEIFQLIKLAFEAREIAASVREDADNGEFDGESVKITAIIPSTEPGGGTKVEFSDGEYIMIYNGLNGASVGIDSVEETDEPGEYSTVTFSDGKVLRIRNGLDGHGSGGGAVDSVNGKTGDVVLTADDVNAYDKATIDQKLSEKMEFYKVTVSDTVPLHFIDPDGNPMTYQDLVDKYNDPKAFLYAEYQYLTFIPSLPPFDDPMHQGEGSIEFICQWMYMGQLNTSRLICNEQNLVKYETVEAAKKSDIPEVPKKVSAFENDAGYLTEHQSLAEYVKDADLAEVAKSGSYEDLSNTPTIPAAYDDTAVRELISQKYTKPGTGIPATDLASGVIPTVPTALPNPNALTFTGATTASYDGSNPVTVNIPTGGGGDTRIASVSYTTTDEDAATLGANDYLRFSFPEVTVPPKTISIILEQGATGGSSFSTGVNKSLIIIPGSPNVNYRATHLPAGDITLGNWGGYACMIHLYAPTIPDFPRGYCTRTNGNASLLSRNWSSPSWPIDELCVGLQIKTALVAGLKIYIEVEY